MFPEDIYKCWLRAHVGAMNNNSAGAFSTGKKPDFFNKSLRSVWDKPDPVDLVDRLDIRFRRAVDPLSHCPDVELQLVWCVDGNRPFRVAIGREHPVVDEPLNMLRGDIEAPDVKVRGGIKVERNGAVGTCQAFRVYRPPDCTFAPTECVCQKLDIDLLLGPGTIAPINSKHGVVYPGHTRRFEPRFPATVEKIITPRLDRRADLSPFVKTFFSAF